MAFVTHWSTKCNPSFLPDMPDRASFERQVNNGLAIMGIDPATTTHAPKVIKPTLGNYRQRYQVGRMGPGGIPKDGQDPGPTTSKAKEPQPGINRKRYGRAPNPILDDVE